LTRIPDAARLEAIHIEIAAGELQTDKLRAEVLRLELAF
jgi:hypothetical protein